MGLRRLGHRLALPAVRLRGRHADLLRLPRTYGFSAWYNPWTGGYGRASAVYGPFGGAGAGAVYNPGTGTYARGAAAYGPYGSRAVAQAWNPRTGTSAQTRQGSSIYGSWGSTAVQRGDDWARSARVSNAQTGTTTRGVQTSGGAGAVTRTDADGRSTVARGAGGDVYAGHDGNVYRKQNGSWQQWGDTGWTPTSGIGRAVRGRHSRPGQRPDGTWSRDGRRRRRCALPARSRFRCPLQRRGSDQQLELLQESSPSQSRAGKLRRRDGTTGALGRAAVGGFGFENAALRVGRRGQRQVNLTAAFLHFYLTTLSLMLLRRTGSLE